MVLPQQTQVLPKFVGIYKTDFQDEPDDVTDSSSCLKYEMSFHLTKGEVCKTLVVMTEVNGVYGRIHNPTFRYHVYDSHKNRPWLPVFAREHESFAEVIRDLRNGGFRNFTAQHISAAIHDMTEAMVQTQFFHRPVSRDDAYGRPLAEHEFDAVLYCIHRHLLSSPDSVAAD
jgi:hypothetical protein